jgi:hypothetical protein
MPEVKYGLDARDISFDDLARLLASALKVPLYRNNSPMSGPSYSSFDLNSVLEAVRAGDRATVERLTAAAEAGLRVELRPNDPEPGYLSPEHPMGGTYILDLRTTDPAQLQAFEDLLVSLPVPMRRLLK